MIEASASDDACARLISLTQRSCSAKVNCSAAAAVADEAFEAYQVCLSGGTLAQSALNDLIDRAGGEMEFVCCIATGLPHRADSR